MDVGREGKLRPEQLSEMSLFYDEDTAKIGSHE